MLRPRERMAGLVSETVCPSRPALGSPPSVTDRANGDDFVRKLPCAVPIGGPPTRASESPTLPFFNTRSIDSLALANPVEFQHTDGMSTSERDESDSILCSAQFETTHWSIVLSAGAKNSPVAAEALEGFVFHCANGQTGDFVVAMAFRALLVVSITIK